MAKGKINFFRIGWETYHRAVLDFGADAGDIDEEEDGPPSGYVYPDIYENCASALISFCRIEPQSVPPLARAYRSIIWRRLRNALNKSPTLWNLITNCPSPSALVERFRESGVGVGLSDLPSLNIRQPRTVANYGHHLILNHGDNHPDAIRQVAWGLALIGWSYMTFQSAQYCELCFRRAWPGRRHCETHSQSEVDEKNRSAKYMQYRIGQKICHLAKQRGIEFHPRPTVLDSRHASAAIMQVLFPLESNDDPTIFLNAIARSVLAKTPLAASRLGDIRNLSDGLSQVAKRIREVLDPHMLNDKDAFETLRNAEKWLTLEAEVAPGKRGRGRKTQILVLKAIELAERGYTKTEIANSLNIRKSVLSNWLTRYPVFREAFQAVQADQ